MIEVFYTDEFVLPLPKGHRFPMQKYRLLRDKVSFSHDSVKLSIPPAATRGQLALAHCTRYIERVLVGGLSESEQKAIGFPWSEQMVERSLRSAGATIAACRSALQHGASVNLAGGTHHAKFASGSGFCVFNDIAVAARVMQTDALASPAASKRPQTPRVLVVDLDVHQGDGTAEITEGDSSVFTFSMHGASNFPFTKMRSDLDIDLPNGTGDTAYLTALQVGLEQVGKSFKPDLIIYVAGMDAHRADRLGKLDLSDEGIEQRDHLVMAWALERRLPIVMVMAGGYFPDLDHLTDLQARTVARLASYAGLLRKNFTI